eukprot:247541_1
MADDLDDILQSCLSTFVDIPAHDDNCTQKMTELDELVVAFKDQSIGASDISVDLLNPCDIYGNFHCAEKLIAECESLKRIHALLVVYSLYIQTKQVNDKESSAAMNIDDIYNHISSEYNNVHLLNDFNHLLYAHATEFEAIYNILSPHNKSCELSQCLLMRRNQRDRENKQLLRQLYFASDATEVMCQQLMDRIHCHYFHSFDIGYRLSNNERQRILNDAEELKHNDDEDVAEDRYVSDISTLLRNKREKYKNVSGLERLYGDNSNKFRTKMPEQIRRAKAVRLNEYRFGFRFFYHNAYQNDAREGDPAAAYSNLPGVKYHEANVGYTLKELYIEAKYNDLKDELLHNEICCVNVGNWNNLDQKAAAHISTDIAKQMRCVRTDSAKYYEMNNGATIGKQHLIAATVYCVCDLLQQKFTQTFRRINDAETIFDIKRRHRNFYFLARLLRECVEGFGMEHNNLDSIRVYHGINDQFAFKSLFGYIKGPFSTTLEYSVAVNFSDNKGMVLALDMDVKSWILKLIEGHEAAARVTCFDMQWLSDYSNEAEIFHMGGVNRFYFNTIIDSVKSTNYAAYVRGLKQMTSGMSHGGVFTDSFAINTNDYPLEKELQMVYRLLAHQFYEKIPNHKHAIEFKGCPLYIQQLVKAHCADIKLIQINQAKHAVLDRMLRLDSDWVNLDVITAIFPNVNNIKYWAYGKDLPSIQTRAIYQSILEHIDDEKNNSKLTHVDLSFDLKHEEAMREFAEKEYKSEFEKRNWNIYVFRLDPIAQWSRTSGIAIEQYIKEAQHNEAAKMFGDQMCAQYQWVLNILLKQKGMTAENFSLWNDYDKLVNVHIGMEYVGSYDAFIDQEEEEQEPVD